MFSIIKNKKPAFGGVEILLAASILSLILVSLMGLLFYTQDAILSGNLSSRASLVAEEGLEAVSSIRDREFSNLIEGLHGLSFSGGEWIFSGDSDQVGEFTRSITVSSISENVKKIAVLVTWFKSQGRLGSISMYKYLTNWQEFEGGEPSLIDVDITIDSDWDTGYCANVVLTTESTTPIIWDLDIILDTYPKNGIVNNVWEANWSFIEPILSVSGLAYNETVVVGSPVNFGYCANRETSGIPPGEADYDITITSDWGTGYCADVAVSTTSVTPIAWYVDIDFSTAPINGAPTSVWNADWTFENWVLHASGLSYNEIILDGSPTSFGFCADRTVVPPPLEQAYYLNVNTANSRVNPGNNQQVIGTTLSNDSLDISIILEEIVLTWSGVHANTRISSVIINGATLWSGIANSGDVLTLSSPFTLNPSAGPYTVTFVFNRNTTGINLYTRFIMADGSDKLVDIFSGGGADVTPPADITNLSSIAQDHESVTLSWTAPGDDGSTGLASHYEIKYSQSTINDSNWNSATLFANPPIPEVAGTTQSVKVDGLSLSTNYYFAIKTYDDSDNVSGLSNVLNVSTTALSDASYLYVNINGAVLGPSPLSNNNVSSIILNNNSLNNIFITAIGGSWSSSRIRQIYINGVSIWTGDINSGGTATLSPPYILSPSGGPYNLRLRFQHNFSGRTINYLDFTLSDGSVKRSDSKSF